MFAVPGFLGAGGGAGLGGSCLRRGGCGGGSWQVEWDPGAEVQPLVVVDDAIITALVLLLEGLHGQSVDVGFFFCLKACGWFSVLRRRHPVEGGNEQDELGGRIPSLEHPGHAAVGKAMA